jgi:hypothetical protein
VVSEMQLLSVSVPVEALHTALADRTSCFGWPTLNERRKDTLHVGTSKRTYPYISGLAGGAGLGSGIDYSPL